MRCPQRIRFIISARTADATTQVIASKIRQPFACFRLAWQPIRLPYNRPGWHQTGYERKRIKNRNLQAVRRSLRVDEEDFVSAIRIEKWLVIGFAAWLANLGAGGGGIGNFNYPDNRREDAHKLNETIGQIPQPVLITGICVLVCVVLLLIVLFAWLRARGRFILVDCIVRNRAAIVEPWKEFRAEGNSFFLFSLLVVLVLIAVIVIAGARAHCAVYPRARSG